MIRISFTISPIVKFTDRLTSCKRFRARPERVLRDNQESNLDGITKFRDRFWRGGGDNHPGNTTSMQSANARIKSVVNLCEREDPAAPHAETSTT